MIPVVKLLKLSPKHRIRKIAVILKELEEYLAQGEHILEKLNSSLGKEDSVYVKFEKAMEGVRTAFHFIHEFIEKGKSIEDF